MPAEQTKSKSELQEEALDYYRLLGLNQFEANLKVIEQAVCRCITDEKRQPHGPSIEKLDLIVEARQCLMEPMSKRLYDERLRDATRKGSHITKVDRPSLSRTLGKYELKRKIGSGGMGDVYMARHIELNHKVAIKVLANNHHEVAIKRFLRESKILANLKHPNIIVAYDAGHEADVHFLVMEYGEGQDLSSIVKKEGPLQIDKAVDYISQAARGLSYVHHKGIVHRDVKPSNLLLDHTGMIKILDLGLAKFFKYRENLTKAGSFMGTLDYMAPEQADDKRIVDHRADIFSLGCTLYTLLTGKPCCRGKDSPSPSLRMARGDVSPDLDAIFQKMVSPLRRNRYQLMEEVLQDLAKLDALSQPEVVPQAGQIVLQAKNLLVFAINEPNATVQVINAQGQIVQQKLVE